MKIPEELRQFLLASLEKIKIDKNHHFSSDEKIKLLIIFDDFFQIGKNFPSISIKIPLPLAWLGLITCYKILPIWEIALQETNNVQDYRTLPQEIIETCKDVLETKITIEEAQSSHRGHFYYALNLLRTILSEKVFSVVATAYDVLGLILYGVEPDLFSGDFTNPALLAYAGIDNNKPGMWNNFDVEMLYYEIINLGIEHQLAPAQQLSLWDAFNLLNFDMAKFDDWAEERVNFVKEYTLITYDTTKTMEFWEWWLTEAIPQAWELAHSALDNRTSL